MRIGALAGRQQKFARLENRLKIASGKSECLGGKPEANGSAFPRSKSDLAEALEFQQGPRHARHNVSRKKENCFLPGDGAFIDNVHLDRQFVGALEILLFTRGLVKLKRL